MAKGYQAVTEYVSAMFFNCLFLSCLMEKILMTGCFQYASSDYKLEHKVLPEGGATGMESTKTL